jgi:hypothetical protein
LYDVLVFYENLIVQPTYVIIKSKFKINTRNS